MNEMRRWILDLFETDDLRYLPEKVLAHCLDNDTNVYDKYLEEFPDLSVDTLKSFFETYFSDRNFLNQDFTPDDIALLMAELVGGPQEEVLDECAGIGTLLIPQWKKNQDVTVYARELSAVAIPFLLFNLALRNMQGIVIRGDTLSYETFSAYLLQKGEKYSTITELDLEQEYKRIDPLMILKMLYGKQMKSKKDQ